MADKLTERQKQTGSGDLDYGHNKPTGGTEANNGKINPQDPSSGTENYHPEKKPNPTDD